MELEMLRTALTVFALASALTALSSIAHATTMPPEMQGSWCHSSDNGASFDTTLKNGYSKLVTKYSKTIGTDGDDIKCDNTDWLVIDQDGYSNLARQGGIVTKTSLIGAEHGRPVYEIDFESGGHGTHWNEAWMAYVTADGHLSIRVKITNSTSRLDLDVNDAPAAPAPQAISATVTMPLEMEGAWCYASDNGATGKLPKGFEKLVTLYNKIGDNDNCGDGGALWIDQKGFSSEHINSNLVKVTRMGNEHGRPVYQIDFRCNAHGDIWNESWRTYVTAAGQLQIRTTGTPFS
jgi:hypothetical protein